MKKLGYYIFKLWVSVGLFCYYRKIHINGFEHIPRDRPVLFLSNHQNALMDVLLIATKCKRKPWFLTRSDVFLNPMLNGFFKFLQMLPIYRLRDGKDKLAKNPAIFDQCAKLLQNNEALVLFPEANHNLKRRVRPLSKGFTRIIDSALQIAPELLLFVIPIGQNYRNATQTGDAAALYFGKPIMVSHHGNNQKVDLKETVSKELKQFTTHIGDEDNYDEIIKNLNNAQVNYLDPKSVNKQIQNRSFTQSKKNIGANSFSRFLFYLLNLPIVFLWRLLVKPKVPEPEFMATFRFGFAILGYPLFYVVLFFALQYAFAIDIALVAISGHFICNLILIKIFGIT